MPLTSRHDYCYYYYCYCTHRAAATTLSLGNVRRLEKPHNILLSKRLLFTVFENIFSHLPIGIPLLTTEVQSFINRNW